MPLPPGPYEHVITEELAAALAALSPDRYATRALGAEWMQEALARQVGQLVLRYLAALPAGDEEDRALTRVSAARRLLTQLAEVARAEDLPAARPDALTWVADAALGVGSARPPEPPANGLVQPTLLFNGRNDVSLASELGRELDSADAVDAVVAFLKPTGLRLLLEPLRRFRDRRGGHALRLITTTYTGATDAAATDALASLGFQVKVAREDEGTRLHAKAWCFHRASGLSTVYVGSSNLSRAALIDGVEWNVRVTQATTPALIDRFHMAFDQLWSELGPPYRPGQDLPELEGLLAQARGEKSVGGAVLRIGARPRPHQVQVLDALAAERRCGHHHNLVVAATGTGKTWIAAFDYRRLAEEHPGLRLLFVAHRQEILEQSRQVFRDVLGDPGFGELYVGGERPVHGAHVFASIQSLARVPLSTLPPEHYPMVIVDEFHHAAATTYTSLLQHLRPRWLLGLTATPERLDGQSVLSWFDHRMASEQRLWDALSAGLLVPFHYFGVADETRAEGAWKRGRLDLDAFENVVTADDVQARRVVEAVGRYADAARMRALGFCAGVAHARRMARHFEEAGLPAVAIDGTTPDKARREALDGLRRGALRAVFTVDLFNEGVDLPEVDTVLLLRPTESATVFLQQIGRGLRRCEGKAVLTVLDFVGHLHQDFRFEARYQALLGGTRRQVADALARDFPVLPPGCALRLEPAARELVLAHIRASLGSGQWARLVADLRQLPAETTLGAFLERGAEFDDVYGRGWTALRRAAGYETRTPLPGEAELQRRVGRMQHIDDPSRLDTWRRWLRSPRPPALDDLPTAEVALAWMLFACLGDRAQPLADLAASLDAIWAHGPLRDELAQLLDVLAASPTRERGVLDLPIPIHVHARYTRDEIIAAWRVTANGRLRELREGVLWVEAARTDLLFVTLDKTEALFRPQVRYADYPVDPWTFHWESQNQTRADSPVGRRYRSGEGKVVLFVRERRKDALGRTVPYTCLGPARFLEHSGERPMKILWRLETPMPETVLAAGRITA